MAEFLLGGCCCCFVFFSLSFFLKESIIYTEKANLLRRLPPIHVFQSIVCDLMEGDVI